MMKNQTPGWYAVLGDPIEHSLSPQIHQAFARQAGISLVYKKVNVRADEFESSFNQLIQNHLLGANVTVPHKFLAFQFATEKTARAQEAQAANTLIIKPDAIIADNTDGVGLITDIQKNAKFPLKDKHILVIGAGGAVSGVLSMLLEQKPASLTLTNRSVDKSEALAAAFATKYPAIPIVARSFGETGLVSYDLIINGTSASLSNQKMDISPAVFSNAPFVYDMMYGPQVSFLEQAKTQGAGIVRDGLGMLVEQAAESFFLWHGIRPQTEPVLDEIRKQINRSCYD